MPDIFLLALLYDDHILATAFAHPCHTPCCDYFYGYAFKDTDQRPVIVRPLSNT